MMVIFIKINFVKLVYITSYHLQGLLQIQALNRKINFKKIYTKHVRLVFVSAEV